MASYLNRQSNTRMGKWTPAEEMYAREIIAAFSEGTLIDVEEGKSLRGCLAEKLHTNVKRISKKYEGTNYNGKRPYSQRRMENLSDAAFLSRQERLKDLKLKFEESVKLLEQETAAKKKSNGACHISCGPKRGTRAFATGTSTTNHVSAPTTLLYTAPWNGLGAALHPSLAVSAAQSGVSYNMEENRRLLQVIRLGVAATAAAPSMTPSLADVEMYLGRRSSAHAASPFVLSGNAHSSLILDELLLRQRCQTLGCDANMFDAAMATRPLQMPTSWPSAQVSNVTGGAGIKRHFLTQQRSSPLENVATKKPRQHY